MTDPPIVRSRVSTPPSEHQPKPSGWSFILENRAAMFGLLFCVTGFLGLPLLWRSQKFTHKEKTIWSIIVVIYTLILIAIVFGICWWSYRQITQSISF